MTDALQLDLGFERHPMAGTRMVRRIVRYPYVITNTFRLDPNPSDMLSIILQSASGAIRAEDRLAARVIAGAATAVHLRTAAAGVVHRAREDGMAQEQTELIVGPGALLELVPEPKILFAGSALSQRLRIAADPDGTAIVADGFLTHDPHGRNAPFRRLCATIEIVRPDGMVLALDRLDIGGQAPTEPGSRFPCHGVLIVVHRLSESQQAAMLAFVTAATTLEGLYAAASPLPSDAGISLRLAARSGAVLRSATRRAWAAARFALTGSLPGHRRC